VLDLIIKEWLKQRAIEAVYFMLFTMIIVYAFQVTFTAISDIVGG